MAYVAGLRNENSGAYHHFKLALRYTDEEAGRFLCAGHEQIFGESLAFPLEQQRRDLKEHLESIKGERGRARNVADCATLSEPDSFRGARC